MKLVWNIGHIQLLYPGNINVDLTGQCYSTASSPECEKENGVKDIKKYPSVPVAKGR